MAGAINIAMPTQYERTTLGFSSPTSHLTGNPGLRSPCISSSGPVVLELPLTLAHLYGRDAIILLGPGTMYFSFLLLLRVTVTPGPWKKVSVHHGR